MEIPPENEQLENYLDRLCVWLSSISEAEREDVRLELRQHFQAIASAEVECGATPEEAVTAALRRLGEADELGRRLRRAWREKLARQIQAQMPAKVRLLQRLFLVAVVVLCTGSFGVWMWADFVLPANSWPLNLVGSALVGTAFGLLQTFYEAKLSLLMPPISGRQAQTLSEMAMALPPQTSLLGIGLLRSVPLPLKITVIALLVALAQGQPHDGMAFAVARALSQWLTVFAAKDVVTSTWDRLTRRRQAEQPS